MKSGYLPDHAFTNTYPSAQVLIRTFKTGSRVNRITVCGVIEKLFPTKIPHNCKASVDPYTSNAKRNILSVFSFPEYLSELVNLHSAGDAPGGMIRLFQRCTKYCMHSVAHNFIYRTTPAKNDFSHFI